MENESAKKFFGWGKGGKQKPQTKVAGGCCSKPQTIDLEAADQAMAEGKKVLMKGNDEFIEEVSSY